MHLIMPYEVLFTMLALEFYSVHMLDKCLHAWSAIYTSMTLNEYSNV